MSEINKNELTKKMSDNLLVLRNKLRLNQSELAEKVGISRQTLLEIEKGKRIMQWNTFVALLAVSEQISVRVTCLSILRSTLPNLANI